MQREGCVKLHLIARDSAVCAQSVVDAGGVAAVVTALQTHPSEVGVQRTSCGALFSIAHCGAAYPQQAVLADAAGAVAVVAALQAHLSHVAVQQNGCGALNKIAHGGAICA